jgi:hypothetical protein
VGGTALPVVVCDALIGAADEQLRAGADAPVGRRIVQRCRPAGRGGHGCIGAPSVTADHAPGSTAAKAHPSLCLASTSARAPSSAATIARSSSIAA